MLTTHAIRSTIVPPIVYCSLFFFFRSPIYYVEREGRLQQYLGKGSYIPLACVVSMLLWPNNSGCNLRLKAWGWVRGKRKGMYNRLSIRRYSVSTGAYILIVVQELGLQRVRKGWSPTRHTMWCYLVARHNGQWNIRERWKKKGTRNRYQKHEHNTRMAHVSPTIERKRK